MLGGRERVYLAVPEIARSLIGPDASALTGIYQARCAALLGHTVVSFWLKQVQLQCVSVAASAMRKVRRREEDQCKLCAYVRNLGATGVDGVPLNQRLAVSHLARRSDAFWRVLHATMENHPTDPGWLFSEEGTRALWAALKSDSLHCDPKYMVLLCRYHDRAVQRVMYPRETLQRTGHPETG